MAFSKIRRANKKWKHEHRRQKRQTEIRKATAKNKIIRNRSRKMYLEGQREARIKRQRDVNYVENMKAGLLSEQ